MTRYTDIDKVFQQGLGDYKESPPIDAWESIKENLEHKSKKKKIAYIRAVAATIAVLIAFNAGYFLSKNKFNPPKNSALSYLEKNNNSFVKKSPNNVQSNKEKIYSFTNKNNIKKNVVESTNTHKNTIQQRENNTPVKSNKETTIAKVVGKKVSSIPTTTAKISQKTKSAFVANDAFFETVEKSNKSNQQRKSWSFGGNIAPIYSYRTAQNVNPDVAYSSIYSNNVSTTDERGIFTYSGGVNLGYHFNKRLSIQSGVYYAQLGQEADNVKIYHENPVFSPNNGGDKGTGDNYSGTTTAGEVKTGDDIIKTSKEADDSNPKPETSNLPGQAKVDNIIQNFEYIEVPLIAKYKLIDKKIDLNFIGGVNAGILVGNNIYRKEENKRDKIGETQNINQNIYNTITGMGVEYKLTKNISMTLEPTVKYSIISINEENTYNYRPYSFGVFSGISYKFW